MTSPPTSAPTNAAPNEEAPPFAPTFVEELLRVFVKSLRAHQLYLPNNPIYKSAIDTVRNGFLPIWQRTDELVLSFSESDVRWAGQVVLADESKSADSLPWIFYKDGVRELKIIPGFEDTEIVQLLDIIQKVRKANAEDDDLLTLLWESDFTTLRYRYVDLGLEPAAPLEDGAEPKEHVQAGEVSAAVEEAVKESTAGNLVNMSDFDSTLYFLDEREIDYLQKEIDREYKADLRQNVLAIVLDIFETQADGPVREEIAEILESLLVLLLAAGQFRGVAYLLREAQVAAQRGRDVASDQRERLSQLPARLSAPESLSQLLQALDESPELPPQDELSELFEQLRPAALGTVFAWLDRLENARLRPLLEQAAGRLASTNSAELVKLILSNDVVVAREAVKRAGALKTLAAVGSIAKLLSDGEADIRLLSVSALTEIGSPGALQALERAVEDRDRDVRVATVKALAARAYRPVLARVEGMVKGKVLKESDLTEKMAFFEGYGALCGEGGVAYLDGLLNGKSMFGRKEDPETRACAAIALGRVGSKSAMDALRKANEDKDVVVRNAVNRGLRGGAGT
ncbi:MAG: hypothetical protein JWO05_3178 [Gemmatimonadetes bacterium]|nr:hypothetical protein [Gemmatimonadota bacterium]